MIRCLRAECAAGEERMKLMRVKQGRVFEVLRILLGDLPDQKAPGDVVLLRPRCERGEMTSLTFALEIGVGDGVEDRDCVNRGWK
jgi:hypothetical protein